MYVASFLSCSISQLNKQLVEQQSAVTNDKHENGTDTSTSDSQPDSLSALKEKIAELEDELETAKLEHKKTVEKLKVCSYMCVHTPMCSSDMTNCTYVEPYWDHTIVIDSALVLGHITAHRVYTVHVWGVGWGCTVTTMAAVSFALYCCIGRALKKTSSHLGELLMP